MLSIPRKLIGDSMSGVLLGSGHTDTIYQARTKIPDSLKECRWSAYTILFYTNRAILIRE